jgi:hypothetical protein
MWGKPFRLAKRKAAWGVVFGLMMALPGISGAQQSMTVNVTSATSTENGSASLKTDYTSRVGVSGTGVVEQNQYSNKVFGVGSPTTVIAEFATNGDHEIGFAGLTILKDPEGKGTATMLQALEKIGTGYEGLNGSFAAAGGSEIKVTETEHSTTASTKGGGVYYLVESSGVGMIKVGVAGEFCSECAPVPEIAKKGGINCLQTSPGRIGQSLEPGSQSARMNVEYSGRYKSFFEGTIAPPK